VDRFEVTRRGRVRRAALYYLRERTGKATRIKEKRTPIAPRGAQKAAVAANAATTPQAPVQSPPVISQAEGQVQEGQVDAAEV
jgi:hypothetical protein